MSVAILHIILHQSVFLSLSEANLLRAFLVFLFQHFDQFQRRRQEHSSNCSRIFRSSANYTHLVIELKIDVMNES